MYDRWGGGLDKLYRVKGVTQCTIVSTCRKPVRRRSAADSFESIFV